MVLYPAMVESELPHFLRIEIRPPGNLNSLPHGYDSRMSHHRARSDHPLSLEVDFPNHLGIPLLKWRIRHSDLTSNLIHLLDSPRGKSNLLPKVLALERALPEHPLILD